MTKNIKAYEFEELDDKTQEKIVQREIDRRRRHGDSTLPDFLKQTLKREIENHDFLEQWDYGNDLELYYSLGYSQGDGASFEGALEFTDEENQKWYVTIKQKGHYLHKNTMKVSTVEAAAETEEHYNFEEMTRQEIVELEQETGAVALDLAKGIADDIKELGYDTIDDYESEERARQHIKEFKDCLYLEDGTEVSE